MADTVQIGKLNRKVTIKTLQYTTNSLNEEVAAEVDYKSVWAELKDVSGNEYEEGKIFALNVRKYTIRFDKTILKEGVEYFVFDNDEQSTYNINSVEVVGFRNYLTLKCSKRE